MICTLSLEVTVYSGTTVVKVWLEIYDRNKVHLMLASDDCNRETLMKRMETAVSHQSKMNTCSYTI